MHLQLPVGNQLAHVTSTVACRQPICKMVSTVVKQTILHVKNIMFAT